MTRGYKHSGEIVHRAGHSLLDGGGGASIYFPEEPSTSGCGDGDFQTLVCWTLGRQSVNGVKLSIPA